MKEQDNVSIQLKINGQQRTADVDSRSLLVEAIRDGFDLKGTHIGCLTGDCGACTVIVDGKIAKSCLTLAVSSEGCEITTIEGMATGEVLHPVQQSFWDEYGFQCGYCLPGMLFSSLDLIENNADPDEGEIRQALNGNLCRCTGYQKTVKAVAAAAKSMSSTPVDKMIRKELVEKA